LLDHAVVILRLWKIRRQFLCRDDNRQALDDLFKAVSILVSQLHKHLRQVK
jgi:hypothetical protein